MRLVTYTDSQGKEKQSWIPDDAPDSQAPFGIAHEPPSLDDLDWDAMKRDIHERLAKNRIITYSDIKRTQGLFRQIVVSVVNKHTIQLFRNQ